MVDLEGYDGFQIKSKEMEKVFEAVYDFAHQAQPIIMFGPSGSGKEYLARYYYAQYLKASKRKGDFISVNCSQLVKETTQSTLFGHKKGSFTDAKEDKAGQFELAENGVLFLDEIGELDHSIQSMVNRAMDENTREAMKFGDKKPYTTRNVIVICATESPKSGLNDSLLYRSGLQVYVPGLDERNDDVEEAIKFFCLKAVDKRLDTENVLLKLFKHSRKDFADDLTKEPELEEFANEIAIRLGPFVRDRNWPGNFRALRAAVDSGVIRAKKLNSEDGFIGDVEKYFHQHLGDYSIADEDNQTLSTIVSKTATDPGVNKWMNILAKHGIELDDKENVRLCQFLSEYEDIPFNREVFEKYMKLSTRNAQYRIAKLRDKKNILENVKDKRAKYQVSKEYRELVRQGINPSHFMELHDAKEGDFIPGKNLEARDLITNARGIFVSEDDIEKREKFLGSLGNSLQEDYDVIYYSFREHKLDDFITACIEHLSNLDMPGWFRELNDDTMELKEKISGLSGYMVQSLSRHRKTIIIFEGIEAFYTSGSQALIEQLIFYWKPVQFVLGSKKQFYPQKFAESEDFSELKLSDKK